ncbi:MAG TPA: hypothetical protein VHF69_06105, partial [Candidatus Synoicihabitans sp.]|nr:hypothetical protein [Candidatus Synoicihabitans sp.]
MSTRGPAEARHVVREAVERPEQFGVRQWSGWVVGPLLLMATIVLPAPGGLSEEAWRTAGVASLMAIFWIS